jgi:perosamine synthetase
VNPRPVERIGDVFEIMGLLMRPKVAGGVDLVFDYAQSFGRIVADSKSMPALAFWKGRVALWTLLRAMDLRDGDEVVLPAYTCEMLPIAVRFAGAKCVFVDVEPGGINCSPAAVYESVTSRTKAVICQHTYGIRFPVEAMAKALGDRGVTIIEDCCQLISSDESGFKVRGDAAFFSTQWSKPLSTGLGGIAVFSNETLYRAARDILDGFPKNENWRRAMSLGLQLALNTVAVWPRSRAWVARLYRWSQRAGIVKGTTAKEEYGDTMPPDYLCGAINLQAAIGKKQLARWDKNVRHRRGLTERYLRRLKEAGIDVGHIDLGQASPGLWTVPLFLENVGEVLKGARRRGLPIESWFGTPPPVHVAPETAPRFGYRMGQCPRSERMIAREIHFLTSPAVTLKQADDAVDFVKRFGRVVNAEGLMSCGS